MSIVSTPPVDELLVSWRESLQEMRDVAVTDISTQVNNLLSESSVISSGKAIEIIQDQVGDKVWGMVSTDVLPACRDWMKNQGLWSEEMIIDDIQPELENINDVVPKPTLVSNAPCLSYDPYSWVIPCFFGGIVGGLLFGWIGAVIFATAIIAGLGWLLHQPEISNNLVSADHNKKYKVYTKQRLLIRVLTKLQLWIVSLVIRPYSESDNGSFSLSQVREYANDYFTSCADFVLLICWARVTVMMNPLVSEPVVSDDLSVSLLESIGVLEKAVKDSDEGEVIDVVHELLQTFKSEGYVWQSVDRGTLYDKNLQSSFNTYGNIEEGQPVKTMKKSLIKNGKVLALGTIKRL
jgi:hypothetical protein